MILVHRLTVDEEMSEFGYTPDRIIAEYEKSGFISMWIFGK
jgi:hypothetical protein